MPPVSKKKDDDEQEAQFEIIGDIVAAHDIAKRVFGEDVSARVVYSVFDNLPLDRHGDVDEDELEDFEDDLKKAQEVVAGRFGAAAGKDPEAVMGLFERVFAKVDDDGDNDD